MYVKAAGGPRFCVFCSGFTESEDPISNIMSLMGLTRKEAVKYMRDQEALLLTAIPSKRVVQQHDFYHNVPNEDQEIYAMMSDVERRIYLEQLAKGTAQ